MREIKFRAWDKENKRMVSPDCIYADGSCSYVEEHYQGEQEPSFSRETLTPEGCILMQSTGIFDKNGKEIHEGDIVKYCFKGNSQYYNLKVKDLLDCGMMIQDGFKYEESEVIGNIYENPELLSTNKE